MLVYPATLPFKPLKIIFYQHIILHFMANTDSNSVTVELYDLTITERKDDRFGRVVTTKSLKIGDLIKKAVSHRTDLNASTLQAAYDILKNEAIEEVANGASVEFGLGYFSVGVNGVFIGDNAKWDSAIHSLTVQTTPTAELREAVQSATIDVRGMAEIGTIINSATDVTSGQINSRLTRGGGVNLIGSKIKIVGDNLANGISLINQNTNEITAVPLTSVLINDPSKISFIVPATLATRDYKLSLSTQFSTSGSFLKEPRVYVFDYILNVV